MKIPSEMLNYLHFVDVKVNKIRISIGLIKHTLNELYKYKCIILGIAL